MTVHNRRYKKQILKEASILLEYSRIKNRIKSEDIELWETIESYYEGTLLTEGRLQEQQAIFNWISKLGQGAYNSIKKYVEKASSETKKMAQDLVAQAEKDPVGSKLKSLLKKGDWSEAFKVASKWVKGQEQTSPENVQESLQWLGDKFRNLKVGTKVTMVLLFLTLMFAKADVTKQNVPQDKFGDGIEMVDQNTGDLDKTGFQDNDETSNDLDSPQQGFDSGTQFQFGSSDLDAAGQQQVDQIAQDYMNAIQDVLEGGGTIDSIDLDVQGSASNTGDNWDADNGKDGSLSENRANTYGNALWESMNKIASTMGIDLGTIDFNTGSSGMDANQLGSSEDVGQGEKDNNQNATSKMKVNFHTDAPDTKTSVDLGMQDYDMAKFGGEPTSGKGEDPPTPGVAKGSRNLELRDLLYLGFGDELIAPVTFGDYKSDAEMGRVDWRDIDVSGDKFLADRQKLAVWITNTRKAKFPILKRAQNALQGIIDIEFDGGKKYLGNIGPKYDPSTTTPLTQKRKMGPRGPSKFVVDPAGGYKVNPALTEASQLPPEVIKQPEIPQKIKSLQSNTNQLWKYILGDKAIGSIVTPQVAEEFDKNMKSFLEQLDLMYGKSGTRGNVNFRYRKNPNYQGAQYSGIPTTWNKKITGEPEVPEGTVDWSKASDEELKAIGAKRYIKNGQPILVPPPNGWPQPGQSPEVLPYVQSYTGDYIQGQSGPLVGSANPEDLKEEIKRMKKLMI